MRMQRVPRDKGVRGITGKMNVAGVTGRLENNPRSPSQLAYE